MLTAVFLAVVFAQAALVAHDLARGGIHRRVVGAQHEGTGERDALEALPGEPALQRFDVDADVGKLRHAGHINVRKCAP